MAENQTDITKMTVQELKALAYDQISLLEQTKLNLQLIQQEIAKKGQNGTTTDSTN